MITLIEIRELSRISEKLNFSCIENVVDYCFKKPLEMQTLSQEHLYCFCCDIKNNVKSIEMVSKGSLNTSIVHPREVLKAAILSNAASIILVHNHPSGDPEPSSEDFAITGRMKKACDILGINLLDHIIIGNNNYYSFKDKGRL